MAGPLASFLVAFKDTELNARRKRSVVRLADPFWQLAWHYDAFPSLGHVTAFVEIIAAANARKASWPLVTKPLASSLSACSRACRAHVCNACSRATLHMSCSW